MFYPQLLGLLKGRCVSFLPLYHFTSDHALSLSKVPLAWHEVLPISKCWGEVKEGIKTDGSLFPHLCIFSHWDWFCLIAVKRCDSQKRPFLNTEESLSQNFSLPILSEIQTYSKRQPARSLWILCVSTWSRVCVHTCAVCMIHFICVVWEVCGCAACIVCIHAIHFVLSCMVLSWNRASFYWSWQHD